MFYPLSKPKIYHPRRLANNPYLVFLSLYIPEFLETCIDENVYPISFSGFLVMTPAPFSLNSLWSSMSLGKLYKDQEYIPALAK